MRSRGPEGFRPARSLSQNFLVDPNLCRKLVAAVEPGPGRTVVEVGPGQGALTSLLLDAGARVVAVEKDRRLVPFLRERFEGTGRFRVVEADALELPFRDLDLPPDATSFLSNLPYAITSPMLLHVMTSRFPFRRVVVTMQKEVAVRLGAAAGSRDYGRLSVMVALYGRLERLFDLPPGVFRPRPRVVSTALRLTPDPERWLDDERHRAVEGLVRAAFATRRKRAVTSLARGLDRPVAQVSSWFARLGLDPDARAEDLPPARFVALAGLAAGEEA